MITARSKFGDPMQRGVDRNLGTYSEKNLITSRTKFGDPIKKGVGRNLGTSLVMRNDLKKMSKDPRHNKN